MQDELLSRITANPDVMLGKPTIRGMRITWEQVLRALANGVSEADLLADYPELEPADVRAALMYATELVSEERVFPLASTT